MRKILLSISMLITMSMYGQNCAELFISEYVEGSGNNKALEIYNPTSAAIDLSAYIVIRYSNGNNSASASNAVQLVGSISPNDVHVGVIEKLNASGTGQEVPVDVALQSEADEFYCADYNVSNAWYWNGNDAIVLAKGSVNDVSTATIVDIFGKVGEDPLGGWTNNPATGYTSSGYSWTEDHTLIRKKEVMTGNIGGPLFFDPSLEWDSIPEDSWDNLGVHECDCAGSSSVRETSRGVSYTLYPNPVKRGELASITSNTNIKNVVVTNILGEQVKSSNPIKTSSFSKGTYIIDIEFSNGSFSNNKLIIRD